MDQKHRVVLPVRDMSLRIYTVGETAGRYHWVMQERFDLLPAVPAEYHGNFKTRPMDVVAGWADRYFLQACLRRRQLGEGSVPWFRQHAGNDKLFVLEQPTPSSITLRG